jgi:hypothetical protein
MKVIYLPVQHGVLVVAVLLGSLAAHREVVLAGGEAAGAAPTSAVAVGIGVVAWSMRPLTVAYERLVKYKFHLGWAGSLPSSLWAKDLNRKPTRIQFMKIITPAMEMTRCVVPY